jgi:hypothetical protein
MEPAKEMEDKKVLRSSKVLAGEAERTGWIWGEAREYGLRPHFSESISLESY